MDPGIIGTYVSGPFGTRDDCLSQSDVARLQSWLKPTDYLADSSELNRHLASRAPGTSLWLAKTPRYQQWISSDDTASIWIRGAPGAGKSVLAASTVQHLSESGTDESGVPVLLFFFRKIVRANRFAICLVRDWLAQLLPHSVQLQGALQKIINSEEVGSLNIDDLWECLQQGLASLNKVYCVVDALDEMDDCDAAEFFPRLNELATFRPGAVKVFMTSRPRQDLQMHLAAASIVHISLEEDQVGQEIEVFVAHQLRQAGLDALNEYGSLVRSISSRSKGLLLYPHLLIDQVLSSLIRGRGFYIDGLPIHLEKVYNQILTRQAQELGIKTEVQVALLKCVTHSSRPVRLHELAGFLAWTVPNIPQDESKAIARRACHPLLEILEDESVQVIHHSFSEFLFDKKRLAAGNHTVQFPVLDNGAAHKDIAIACLELNCRVMQGNQFQTAVKYPFFDYSKEFWLHHVMYNRKIDDNTLFEALEAFRKVYIKMPHGLNGRSKQPHTNPSYGFWSIRYDTPLHFAASTGLNNYARKYLPEWRHAMAEQSAGFFGRPQRNPSPLESAIILASGNCSIDLVRILWPQNDLSFEWAPGVRAKILLSAIWSENPPFLKTILELGVTPASDPDVKARMEAQPPNSTECLAELLPFIDAKDSLRLMGKYVEAGQPEGLGVLLRPEFYDSPGELRQQELLKRACETREKSAGHVQCVRILLPFYPDVDVKSRQVAHPFQTEPGNDAEAKGILHTLIRAWDQSNHKTSAEIFDLLIAAGADLEGRDEFGDTPVFSFFPSSKNESSYSWDYSSEASTEGLRYILEAGADVSLPGKDGGGILHRALRRHLDVKLLEMLIDYGADVHALEPSREGDGTRKTPILAAYWPSYRTSRSPFGRPSVAGNTPLQVTEFLISKGVTIRDAGNPLQVIEEALEWCDAESLRILLATDSGETCFDSCLFRIATEDPPVGGTDFMASGLGKQPRDPLPFIQALVESGADLETRRDGDGKTPLLASVVFPKNRFEAFIAAGADIYAQDHNGRDVLFCLFPPAYDWSCQGPNIALMDDIIQAYGLDPLRKDEEGNTLAHLAVTVGLEHRSHPTSREEISVLLNHLIDYGISLRAKNCAGQTPLHILFDDNMSMKHGISDTMIHVHKVIDFFAHAEEVIGINERDNEGLMPLHMAAMNSQGLSAEFLHLLQSYGADLRAKAKHNRNALHLACKARNPASVGYLIDKAPELIHEVDDSGRTPIFDACVSGVVESVGALLRAGAKVDVADTQGWMPLHACAEFGKEQCFWAANELRLSRGEDIVFDRYRPCTPPCGKPRGSSDQFGPRKPKFRDDLKAVSPCVLENEDMAIMAVVRALLDAGADPTITVGEKEQTPYDRARDLDCLSVAGALNDKSLKVFDGEYNAAGSHKSLYQGGSITIDDAVLREPWTAISRLSLGDINRLVEQDANLSGRLFIDNQSAGADTRYILGASFVESVIVNGLTEAAMAIGDAVHFGVDHAATLIDKWTREALLAGKGNLKIYESTSWPKYNDIYWHPEDVKTLDAFLKPTSWTYEPALQVACRRRAPNMEMMRTLVEKCAVDVLQPSLRSCNKGFFSEKEVRTANIILHAMAEEQAFWQLEAMRYLIDRGVDVNARDYSGNTPMHIVLSNRGIFRDMFVKLLLGLGADPQAKNCEYTSCISLASGKTLALFASYDTATAEDLGRELIQCVARLDSDAVKLALDSGADVSRVDKVFKFREGRHDRAYSSRMEDISPLYDGMMATPLFTAILYQDCDFDDPCQIQKRQTIVRLLLERGADLYVTFQNNNYDEYPLIHALFENIEACKKEMEEDEGNTRPRQGEEWLANWDSSGLFLRMLDHGADIAAVDYDGRNALHILLANPGVQEDHILAFLSRPESRRLIHASDRYGFTPLQNALRMLRPTIVTKLLDLGSVGLTEADPNGMTALHHIAGQCLSISASDPNWRLRKPTLQKRGYLNKCKELWKKCIALGANINQADADGNPPLFHYLLQEDDPASFWYGGTRLFGDPKANTDHRRHFDDFFSSADVLVRNRTGGTALHMLAGEKTLKGTRYTSATSRPHRNLFVFMAEGKGIDRFIEDANGQTCLDVAAAEGRQDILELFQQKK
ncbi:hypothetical protein EsH8_I_000178 [Colletotrichum jinshuiense]